MLVPKVFKVSFKIFEKKFYKFIPPLDVFGVKFLNWPLEPINEFNCTHSNMYQYKVQLAYNIIKVAVILKVNLSIRAGALLNQKWMAESEIKKFKLTKEFGKTQGAV